MTIAPNHTCDLCGERFGLRATESAPYIEVEHFLETGCRGSVRQTAPTPLDVLDRQLMEFARAMSANHR